MPNPKAAPPEPTQVQTLFGTVTRLRSLANEVKNVLEDNRVTLLGMQGIEPKAEAGALNRNQGDGLIEKLQLLSEGSCSDLEECLAHLGFIGSQTSTDFLEEDEPGPREG